MSSKDALPEQRSEMMAELRARARTTNNDQARKALTSAAALAADSHKGPREAAAGIAALAEELFDDGDAELMAAHWALRATAATLGAAAIGDARSRGEEISMLELTGLLLLSAEASAQETHYQGLAEQ